jgi:hypothetical protein
MNPEILEDLMRHYQRLVVCQGRQSEISLMPVIKTLLGPPTWGVFYSPFWSFSYGRN